MLRWGTKTNIFYLCAGHYTVDYYNNFLPVLLPFIMVKLDMSLTMCGILVMVLAFVASSIQPFVGYMRYGRPASTAVASTKCMVPWASKLSNAASHMRPSAVPSF